MHDESNKKGGFLLAKCKSEGNRELYNSLLFGLFVKGGVDWPVDQRRNRQ